MSESSPMLRECLEERANRVTVELTEIMLEEFDLNEDNEDDWGRMERWGERADKIIADALTRPSDRPDDVERISEVIHDYLDERFPEGALPGGIQLFADDHLDAEFKHEAGCDELAKRIAAALKAQETGE